MKRLLTAAVILLFSVMTSVSAQTFAVKTNVLGLATASVNAGVEVSLSQKWSLDVSAGYNSWTFADNRKWKHLTVSPGLRYWLCQKLDGHFLAVHAVGGAYNLGNLPNSLNILGTDYSQLGAHRFEGWFVGAGLGYGYAWMLGPHWNIEAEIGAGYAYSRYDRFLCHECAARDLTDVPHHYIGLTRLAVNLVYVF